MIRSRPLALALYLGAAGAGAAIGISVDRLAFRAPHWWDHREMRAWLYDKLDLTATQRTDADHIFDERNHARDSLLAPIKVPFDSVNTRAMQRLGDLLTPSQRTIFDRLQREREARAGTPHDKP